MNIQLLRWIGIVSLSLTPLSGLWAAEPVLVYERQFVLMEEADNRMWVKVFEDGTIEAHFPPFMRDAGSYRRMLSSADVTSLTDALSLFEFQVNDAARAEAELNALRAGNDFSIEDIDAVSIRYQDASGQYIDLKMPAPDALLSLHQGHPTVQAAADLDALVFSLARATSGAGGAP